MLKPETVEAIRHALNACRNRFGAEGPSYWLRALKDFEQAHPVVVAETVVDSEPEPTPPKTQCSLELSILTRHEVCGKCGVEAYLHPYWPHAIPGHPNHRPEFNR